jgi:hypothetical protein
MAWSSAVVQRAIQAYANKRKSWGTFDASSAAGGDIDTGLRICEKITLTCKGSAVAANAPAVDESLPVAGSAVTIVCDSGQQGFWEATGY